jgi:ABC-type transport system involved in Fe-S cluster assembly fused permease/ATPase subunit
MIVSLTTVEFKPILFSISGFALSYAVNIFILMILYDFYFSHAQFCCIIVYVRKVESRVQIADRCAPRKISSGVQNLVLHALQLQEAGVYR